MTSDVEFSGEHISEREEEEHGVPFECHIFPRGGHGAPWCDDPIWSKPPGGERLQLYPPVGGMDAGAIRIAVAAETLFR